MEPKLIRVADDAPHLLVVDDDRRHPRSAQPLSRRPGLSRHHGERCAGSTPDGLMASISTS